MRDTVTWLRSYLGPIVPPALMRHAVDAVQETIAALEKERDEWFKRAMVAETMRDLHREERDAALADNAAKDEALAAYIEFHGAEHEEDDCPEDDTCTCPHLVALNAAFGPPRPGAALLEEHKRALVRARNGGLEKVAKRLIERRDQMRGRAVEDGRRRGLEEAASIARAMKEPESCP